MSTQASSFDERKKEGRVAILQPYLIVPLAPSFLDM